MSLFYNIYQKLSFLKILGLFYWPISGKSVLTTTITKGNETGKTIPVQHVFEI